MIKQIEILKILGILLVLSGHAGPSQFSERPQWFILFIKFIYSFHMPLFFFISGFLYTLFYKEKSYINIMIDKGKRLLLPYVFFITIIPIAKYLFSNFALHPIELDLNLIINQLLYPQNAVILYYWFLITLFITFMFCPIYNNLKIKSRFYLVVISILAISLYFIYPFIHMELLCVKEVAFHFVFFWLGCVVALYYNSSNLLKSFDIMITMMCLMFLFVTTYFNIDNSIIRLMNALLGIVMVWNISWFYIEKKYIFLDVLLNKTYSIYLLHGIPRFFFGRLIKEFDVSFALCFIIVGVTNLLVPFYFIKVINFKVKNNKLAKYIFGL